MKLTPSPSPGPGLTPLYVRRSEESDVETCLYQTSGYMACYDCHLIVATMDPEFSSEHTFYARSRTKLITHFYTHKHFGHKVPNSLIVKLSQDWTSWGDSILDHS